MWRSWTFWRLFGTFGLLWAGSIGLLGAVIVARVDRYVRRHIEQNLQVRAQLVADAVRGPAKAEGDLQQQVLRTGAATGMRLTLIAADGRVLADSEEDPAVMENHGSRPEVIHAATHGFGTDTRVSQTVHHPLMYVAMRLDGAATGPAYVRVALPLEQVEQEIAGLTRIVWSAAGGAALVALALAFWLARRTVGPLHELTEAAEQIAGGGYGHKVYATGHDEIAALARTFNHMSAQLALQFARVEEDRQQLRAILSGMVEGVIALGGDERILFANERAAELLEFQVRTAVGRRLWEVVRVRGLQDVVRNALARGQPQHQELKWNGAVSRSLGAHAAPLATGKGAVLVLHDTSELRQLERLRQDFVANVSHELKTPLSVIKACVETLLDGAVEDLQHRGQFLERIADQAERLHALILDLLSLARIESGEEVFECQAVPLGPAVAACLERHRARAAAKKQALAAEPPPGGQDLSAWVDDEALGQILDNLVDNAVKYTPEGSRITVRWRGDNGQVRLEVEDNGPGIPEQDLPRIFERFYRVDKARSREMGGTGLGLAIVKHLTQALQGGVRATSRLGQGTTFSVLLPTRPAS
jgi:two-component system phosphate regulon sensor histidine kinase PhoR